MRLATATLIKLFRQFFFAEKTNKSIQINEDSTLFHLKKIANVNEPPKKEMFERILKV
jgi:hypothetical protein